MVLACELIQIRHDCIRQLKTLFRPLQNCPVLSQFCSTKIRARPESITTGTPWPPALPARQALFTEAS